MSSFLTPFQRKLLQKNLQTESCAEYRSRLEIMLLADEGKSQAEISKALGCARGTIRYWTAVAKAGEAHHWQEQPIGRPRSVSDDYLARLQDLVRHSPRDYGYAFQRWTGKCLSRHLAKELGIQVGDRHVNRLLKQMGLSQRSQSPEISSAEPLPNIDIGIVINDLPEVSAFSSAAFQPLHPFHAASGF
jgi:transposase